MMRVTHNMLKNDTVYNLNVHQRNLDQLQNNLSTGKKVRIPSEDPVAAAHSMLYRTRINELKTFIDNIEEGEARLKFAEDNLRSIVNIFHRLEELTVQGAHGTYTREDRINIAVEIDEHLKEIVQIANSKFKGESIFSGYQTNINPFEVLKAKPEFADREMITKVIYKGDIGKHDREIEQQEYAPVNLVGNMAFWATNEVIIGQGDVSNYTSTKDQKIRIDGKEIQINNTDTINTIMDKINNADIPVRASLRDNQIVVETMAPHELWMEDIEGGTFLQDIGLKMVNQRPNEFANNVQKVGYSIFDVIMKIRDDLYQNKTRELGSDDLGNLQHGMENLSKNLGEIGARSNRFSTVKKRLNMEELDMTDILAKTENIDVAKTVMDLQMLEYIHKSALAVGARIIRPTLMDFLR
ncbi:MAG: flagellar hook-associated protein 3 [Spirochaetes bacterium]|nr:flagellar hook-associated protein 3 [Spirochaetota bacterium]